eukprot:TRINITY_DN1516_c0_g1_i5.p3 TRINITY_DN1516_c0_g1~~TRINITY_DN1516_c0_g1_i5.p3  ORF type:complete len:151 (+),score=24.79 TRINITY_DN1516_c0_g1_i5:112-564(+)
MIRRPPRSTQGVSSAASDVYKRQVSTQSTWGYKGIMMSKVAITGNSPIPPKTLYYYSNGTGRDTYIATNCGGLFAARKQVVLDSIGISYQKTHLYQVHFQTFAVIMILLQESIPRVFFTIQTELEEIPTLQLRVVDFTLLLPMQASVALL